MSGRPARAAAACAVLMAVALSVALSACHGAAGPPPPVGPGNVALLGQWDLDSVTQGSSSPITTMGHPFIIFGSGGTVRGDDSVNAWSGTYTGGTSSVRIEAKVFSAVGVTSATPASMLKLQAATRALTAGHSVGITFAAGAITLRGPGWSVSGHRPVAVVRTRSAERRGDVRYAYGSLSVEVPKSWAVSTAALSNCGQPSPRTLHADVKAVVELSSCPSRTATRRPQAYAEISCFVGPAAGIFGRAKAVSGQAATLRRSGSMVLLPGDSGTRVVTASGPRAVVKRILTSVRPTGRPC